MNDESHLQAMADEIIAAALDQINRVGYFYDKVIALAVLTDPTTHFIGRDTDADIRRMYGFAGAAFVLAAVVVSLILILVLDFFVTRALT